MMKALELVTLLLNPIVLLQDDIFMGAIYHLLTNILFKDGELDILGGTVQNLEQIVCPDFYPVCISTGVMNI